MDTSIPNCMINVFDFSREQWCKDCLSIIWRSFLTAMKFKSLFFASSLTYDSLYESMKCHLKQTCFPSSFLSCFDRSLLHGWDTSILSAGEKWPPSWLIVTPTITLVSPVNTQQVVLGSSDRLPSWICVEILN